MGPSNAKGFGTGELPYALTELWDEGIHISGLMTMGVPGDMAATRVVFERLRKLADTFELSELLNGDE